MKRITLWLVACLLGWGCYAQTTGEGIRFTEEEAWEKVLQTAREQNKYIFMDCYTSWCGPCKALSKDVFTRPEVGAFFNAHFVNVKYDMEKGEGKTLKERYQKHIIGFPTLLLIDTEGKVVHQMAGYQQPEALIAGMKAGMEGKNLFAFRNRYATGERDLAFLREYIAVLEGAFLKDDIVQVVYDYMNSIPVEKLKEKETWELVGEYVKDPYSPQFEYVVFNLDYFPLKLQTDRYKLERQLGWALEKAVDRIVETGRDEAGNLLPLKDEPRKADTLLRLINRANLKRAEEYRAKLCIHELELAGNWEEVYRYLTVCRSIGALGYSDRYLDGVVQVLAEHCKDKKLLKKCLVLMEELQARENQQPEKFKTAYYETLGLLHGKLGNQKQARKYKILDQQLKDEKAKEFEQFLKKNE